MVLKNSLIKTQLHAKRTPNQGGDITSELNDVGQSEGGPTADMKVYFAIMSC